MEIAATRLAQRRVAPVGTRTVITYQLVMQMTSRGCHCRAAGWGGAGAKEVPRDPYLHVCAGRGAARLTLLARYASGAGV